MTEVKQNCSIIFIGNDLEWINAFEKGVQRFFVLKSNHSEGPWDVQNILGEEQADIVILTGTEQPEDMEVLRPVVQKQQQKVPVMVIDVKPDGLDKWIRQGAEFAVARTDVLTAIKHVQQIMLFKQQNKEIRDVQLQYKSLDERYNRIYKDIADPIAYVQDGLFLEANAAFYRVFGVENEKMLEELTLMNFVPLKSERNIKALLKNVLEKDFVPSEKLELQTVSEERLQMQVQVSKLSINNELAVQMYFRDTEAGGGGDSGLDPTTGLGGPRIMAKLLAKKQSDASEGEVLGYWCYLWIENYREVWQKDGINVAEILMGAVSEQTTRFVPASTEIVRFTDDALALWLIGDKEEVITRIKKLIAHLDTLIPEGIGRLIYPVAFAGMYEIKKESTYEDLSSKSYRTVRALALSQSSDRIAEPTSGELSRKDERRIAEIQAIIDNGNLEVWYQPIALLEPDGIPRFSDKLHLKNVTNEEIDEEDGEATEFEVLLQAAERYGLGRTIDRIKIDLLLQDILSYDGEQEKLNIFLSVSADSLNDPDFPTWIDSQLNQTGIAASQFIFELSVDVLLAAYSGGVRLAELMRPKGSKFALTHIGRMDEEIISLLEHLKPEVLKLDMREIDTYEDDEEARFMTAIKEYESEHNALIIAAEMDSPAQLSHVWPYDIQFIQGEGMAPSASGFNYDFDEPLF